MELPGSERLAALQRAFDSIAKDALTPALVVDLDAAEHNIAAVLDRIGDRRRWRPHIKTLKQTRLVRAIMRRGVEQLKCATLDELALVLDTAERVHPEGEVDVFLAYPASRNVCRGVVELTRFYEGGHVRILADSPEHLDALGAWLGEAGVEKPIDVLLDVDVGMGRTGSSIKSWSAARSGLANVEHVRVVGLHGYEGHLGWDERDAANTAYDGLVGLARELPKKLAKLIVTSGSHSFVHALEHADLGAGPWAHQVSPGTLVLSDLRSAPPHDALGLQHAAFVVTRVVARPGEDRITLDAGSKAIAPDRPAPACAVVGRSDLEPQVPSEEHTPVIVRGGERPAWGEVLWLVPDHVCTTVNLHRKVIYVRGDEVVGRGDVEAMSRTLWVGDPRP